MIYDHKLVYDIEYYRPFWRLLDVVKYVMMVVALNQNKTPPKHEQTESEKKSLKKLWEI